MKLVRKSGTTASQANRGKSVKNSIADVCESGGYGSFREAIPDYGFVSPV
jgi:hypothetical protein